MAVDKLKHHNTSRSLVGQQSLSEDHVDNGQTVFSRCKRRLDRKRKKKSDPSYSSFDADQLVSNDTPPVMIETADTGQASYSNKTRSFKQTTTFTVRKDTIHQQGSSSSAEKTHIHVNGKSILVSSSDSIGRDSKQPLFLSVPRLRRSSCDELKEALVRDTSSLMEHWNVARVFEEMSPAVPTSSPHSESSHGTTTGTEGLSDFDRFVLENREKLDNLEESCFASRVGGVEECALCQVTATTRRKRKTSVTTLAHSNCKKSRHTVEASDFVTLTSSADNKDGKFDDNSNNNNIYNDNCKSCDNQASLTEAGHALVSPASLLDVELPGLDSLFDLSPSLKSTHCKGRKREWGSSEKDGDDSFESSQPSAKVRRSADVHFKSEEGERCSTEGRCPDAIGSMNMSHSESACEDAMTETFSIPDWMYVAIDCEMVGIGPKGRYSALARCSVVDYDGNVLYDKFVCPTAVVTDYRTRWSGVRPEHMRRAEPEVKAIRDIHTLLENKIIVGHSVYNDFRVLRLNPAFYTVRDTAQCRQLVEMAGLEGRGNGLKKLAAELLGRKIQVGAKGHCSVEDARASLDLFKLVRPQFERQLYVKWGRKSDGQPLVALAAFVRSGIEGRSRSQLDTGQFLSDKYWPEDITE